MRNRYDPPTPRAALRLAATAMTAVTLGVLVALPATLETVPAAADEMASGSAPDTGRAAADGHSEHANEPSVARGYAAQPNCAASVGWESAASQTHSAAMQTALYPPTLLGVDGTHSVDANAAPARTRMM